MTNTRKTSPAKKSFCVWGDCIRRAYQEVVARSPKQAYAIAKRRPDHWKTCGWHLNNRYRLSNEVEDISTGEFIAIRGTTSCRTCASEIVETTNGSSFNEGECGPCEYRRYMSQAELLSACEGVCGMIYHDKNNDERVDLDLYEGAERACRRAIAKARQDAV